MDYNKLVMIDPQCPARTRTATLDLEVSRYFYQYYPQTSGSKVGFVSGYSNFFEIEESHLGEIHIAKITLDRNPLMIVSIAVAGIIAIIGAALMVRIIMLVYKVVFKRYNEWIAT
jgi:hypothetical protein